MSGAIPAGDRCEPNLVPILDMVFQLITFFMLVVNFKASEVDLDLHLPVIGSAAPVEEDPSHRDLLVLNIRADGQVAVRGQVQPSLEAFLKLESSYLASRHGLQAGSVLPITVVIRADRETRIQKLLEVVDACRANGFDKFDFVILRGKKKV